MSEENKELIKNEVVDWDIEVQEDGSVIVTQQIETKYKQPYREFLSDFRDMEKNKEKAEEAITEKEIEKRKEEIENLKGEIEKVRPYVDKAEEMTKQHYEQQRKEGIFKKLKEELAKPMQEINTAYMASVWDNISQNEEELLEWLSKEEKDKFQKIKVRKMQTDKLSQRKKK